MSISFCEPRMLLRFPFDCGGDADDALIHTDQKLKDIRDRKSAGTPSSSSAMIRAGQMGCMLWLHSWNIHGTSGISCAFIVFHRPNLLTRTWCRFRISCFTPCWHVGVLPTICYHYWFNHWFAFLEVIMELHFITCLLFKKLFIHLQAMLSTSMSSSDNFSPLPNS